MTATVSVIHAPPPDPEAVAAPGFRSPEVCALAGVSFRQLDYWTRLGLIAGAPNGNGVTGAGNVRLYSHADVVRVALIRVLLDFGCTVRKASAIAAGADPLSSHVEVTAWPVSLIVQMPEIDTAPQGQRNDEHIPDSAAPAIDVVVPCDFFATPHIAPDGAA